MNVPTIDRTQLNNRGNGFPFVDLTTRKKDCNVAKVSEAVELFNGNKLTARETRVLGGALDGPTGKGLARAVFTKQGLVPTEEFITASAQPMATLRKVLHAGWYACGFIDYGEANDAGLPTGDKNYTGIHAIGLWGWRRTGGKRLVWDHDPLFDGRRPAIPFGRQHVDFALVEQALEAYAGVGYWSGWAVKIPL